MLALAVLVLAACRSSAVTPAPSPLASTTATTAPFEYTVLAAGDIASCDSDGDEATADLLDELLAPRGGSVLALGDVAYDDGSATDFARCYDPTWGRHQAQTLPTPGNHEYNTPGATGYFDYFRDGRTGAPDGWYDVQLADAWWIVSLNSNCEEAGGCGSGSPQWEYLTGLLDRVAGTGDCILAFWHHPRWSSGSEHGSDLQTDALWRLLADAGADVVLTGHDHEYERFVPMNADGQPDPAGPVEFVVGTGGRSLYAFADILPTSAAHDSSTYGVLELTLREGAYAWRFVSTEDGGYTDRGSASCD
jgi:hypothetical protein